ncbi:MAG: c-type cytochrome biogenesis protein CcmI [Alphaproteobacteria bacterium]|nr:c-type cytochrome biogenesis protein CcmI [Alphaproteobacteria bacterium]
MIQAWFWLVLGVMTLGAVAAIAVPLVRAKGDATPRAHFNRQVYRDQLRELELDLARGVIGESEAKAARIEIERRLLSAADEQTPTKVLLAFRDNALAAAAAVVLIPVAAIALYTWLGWPDAPGATFAGRAHPPLGRQAGGPVAESSAAAGMQTPHDLDANIVRLKARLDADPNDLQGWLLLGRSYAFTARHDEATAAFQRALTLAPDDPDVQVLVAEAIVMSAGGRVAPEVEKIFRGVMEQDTSHPAARYYLALAKAQAGALREAFDMWRSLLLDSPPDAPWREKVAARVREMGERLGLAAGAGVPPDARGAGVSVPRSSAAPTQAARSPPVSTAPAPASGAGAPLRGPSAADIAAAQKMAPEDRQQMIRDMVEGLAVRLEENPNDAEGWQRLARAYGVLGYKAKANDALGKLAALRPTDVDTLLDYAAALLEARPPGAPFPVPAITVFNQILALNPENAGALYYLGLAEAEAGRIDAARARWRQLLPRLEPGSPSYQTVKRALDSLEK